jgi:large subunit ribosomal protein L13
MKTFIPKEADITHDWFVVDATGKTTGRLAVVIANVLRGRNKPTYTPHVDTGSFVVVVNAEKIKLTGNKEEGKLYQDYSGYSSGRRETKAKDIRTKNPERIITQAVKGMLPVNRMSRQIMTRLKVYVGPEHPHAAQQVQELEFNG